MMEPSLSNAVLEYQQTGNNWEALRKRIYILAYSYPFKWTNWDEDRCGDFFLAFLPRIPGLVRRYKPDYPFESYLTNAMQWYVKTFIEKSLNADHHESYAIQESTDQAVEVAERAAENFGVPVSGQDNSIDPDDCPFPLDNHGRLADPGLRRRILYVALHRAADIDDGRICSLAELAGVSKDWLLAKAAESRRITRMNFNRREELKRRRNECWYLHHRAVSRARAATQPDQAETWNRKSETWHRRFRKAKHNAEVLPVTPSHADIGRMLGSPAGTISSGLFFLRQLWKHIEETGTAPEYIMAGDSRSELDPPGCR